MRHKTSVYVKPRVLKVLCNFPLRTSIERSAVAWSLCEKCSPQVMWCLCLLSLFCVSSFESIVIVWFHPHSCCWGIWCTVWGAPRVLISMCGAQGSWKVCWGGADHCSSGDTSTGFTSVVQAGPGAPLSWCILVCGEFASDDELAKGRELFERQKRGFKRRFFRISKCLIICLNLYLVHSASWPGVLAKFT